MPEGKTDRQRAAKVFDIGCFGIVVKVSESGVGTIESDLHDPANDPEATNADLCEKYGAAMDAIESIVLAHAVAGIDIAAPAYLEGIETAVGSCANEFD